MKYILTIFLLAISLAAYSTDQIDDTLDVDGADFDIEEFPLFMYPKFDEVKKALTKSSCSGSWRGYKASWYVRKNELWLSQIRDDPCNKQGAYLDLDEIFGEASLIEGVFASWVSGQLSYRIGPKYQAAGFKYFEFDAVVYELENGIIKDRTIRRIRVNRD